jgi:hypothetical protein
LSNCYSSSVWSAGDKYRIFWMICDKECTIDPISLPHWRLMYL